MKPPRLHPRSEIELSRPAEALRLALLALLMRRPVSLSNQMLLGSDKP